jgi:polyisoprenoid-binding protein YceI
MLCCLSRRPFVTLSLAACAVAAGTAIASLKSDAHASPAQSAAPAAQSADSASGPVTYGVDDVHSMALFRVQHLGAGQFWGMFNSIKGTATYEPGKSLAMDVSIDTTSVDSGNTKLDEHLSSPDFFDVKEFPSMTFKSVSSEMKSANLWHVTGDLTIRGMTKRVTVPVDVTGVSSSRMGARAGFEAIFNIKRSEYGVSYGVENGSLGDDTRVIVAIEGIKQDPAAAK